VLDFTSALYLGFRHASQDLPGWEQLTLGKPAALEPVPQSNQVEQDLAELIGCERALLATSTLHLFWDLFTVLARRRVNIFLDAGSYPIARWGVERAASLRVAVQTFRAHDVAALRRALEVGRGGRPVIVADGYCPGCGKLAPLTEYVEAARKHGGLVVIDDSQALGIFGVRDQCSPYGRGGGGSVRRAGLNRDQAVVVGASLAKAFGAPLAVLAGSARLVREFESQSATRVHCSPPSAAAVAAAWRALLLNRCRGDSLRLKLFQLVARFRGGLARLGLSSSGGFFPVQTLRLPARLVTEQIHQKLRSSGVSAVLHRAGGDGSSALSFIITARHAAQDIDQALAHLAEAVAQSTPKRLERSNTSCFTDRIMAQDA